MLGVTNGGRKMKKKELTIVIVLVALLLVGTVVILFATGKVGVTKNSDTFASQTDIELFQNVPIVKGEKVSFTEAIDVGDDNYMIYAEQTTLKEYEAYLKTLEQAGFEKYVDNGKEGNSGDVFAAYYFKDNLLVHVCHMVNVNQTMINVCEDPKISDHLFYNDSYVANNIEGAKTQLYISELYSIGNDYVFQLKNGHYIINDGGPRSELPYLLDYLEANAPEGEKPIIEAWFVSHSHLDHMGVLDALSQSPLDCERIIVENVYYSAPSKEAEALPMGIYDNSKNDNLTVKAVGVYLKNSKGESTPLYRSRMGDRYYFNDFTIDVIWSQELLDCKEWKTWNTSCTVLMYELEGQKVLFTGDAEWICQKMYTEYFDSTYFDLDIYQAPHHDIYVYKEFVRACSRISTVIHANHESVDVRPESSNLGRVVDNIYLENYAEESLSYYDGAKILTFPYKVGTAQTLPHREWIHSNDIPKWRQPAETK